ncbi:serine/threonine-protein kinase [Pontibacter sp. SGAir0037]|uniref:protein kinase domain-containing protein n=1 Tax=Pontibacter sp. SGAir0037 TaxID=2571030 RepID=UPI0010CCD3BB|nr:serine/threonine-protein kinase [Pontibacter sp. SGAir0037]QCR21553.1 hypothetical protein C1N53_03790 [Pontibacter sp. SGAir0037]
MDFRSRYKYNPKEDLLGKGGFSRVFKAVDVLLEREVALKVFNSEQSAKYDLITEIKKVIRFQHENLCRYYDVAILPTVTAFGEEEQVQVGVMEYLDGGDLKSYLSRHPQYLNKLLADVLQGLYYLHKKQIIHRDLKPQNILIKLEEDGPVAKITDFGISKALDELQQDNNSALMGTVEYMAPEQFNPQKYGLNGQITTQIDLWSFGIMVYELIAGHSLFGSRSKHTSAERVMSNILGEEYLEKLKILPEPYNEILSLCLVKKVSDRVKSADILLKILDKSFSGNLSSSSIIISSAALGDGDETMVIGQALPAPKPAEEDNAAETQVIELKKPAASASEEKSNLVYHNEPQPVKKVAADTPVVAKAAPVVLPKVEAPAPAKVAAPEVLKPVPAPQPAAVNARPVVADLSEEAVAKAGQQEKPAPVKPAPVAEAESKKEIKPAAELAPPPAVPAQPVVAEKPAPAPAQALVQEASPQTPQEEVKAAAPARIQPEAAAEAASEQRKEDSTEKTESAEAPVAEPALVSEVLKEQSPAENAPKNKKAKKGSKAKQTVTPVVQPAPAAVEVPEPKATATASPAPTAPAASPVSSAAKPAKKNLTLVYGAVAGVALLGMASFFMFSGGDEAAAKSGITASEMPVTPDADASAATVAVTPAVKASGAATSEKAAAAYVSDLVLYKGSKNESVYTGYVKNGMPDGKGELTFKNGASYNGSFVKGEYDKSGTYTMTNGVSCKLQWNKGKGISATLQYPNGSVYKGAFVLEEGNFYENGKGSMTWADGNKYVGNWAKGKKTNGTMYYSDGTMYKGDFVSDKREGKGKFTFADGAWYEGTFKNNEFNGTGEKYNTNGELIESGTYKNGLLAQ